MHPVISTYLHEHNSFYFLCSNIVDSVDMFYYEGQNTFLL